MIPFRKIIFPVDYSEPCKSIVPYVKETMHRFNASLTLVHGYGAEALAYSDLALTDLGLPEEVRVAEENRIKKFAAEHFPGDHVETIVRLGDAGVAVHEAVRHHGADLVMLGTRGQGPMRRFLLGSVTTKVLHDISTAVWTGVGSELAAHKPGIPYRSILCAVDQGEEAECVIQAAAAIAKAYNAQMSIVNVVETPPAAMEVDFGPIKKELIDSADFTLRELKGKLKIDCPHAVLEAPIAEGIKDEALRRHADLIVTGRGHAQGTYSRLWSHLYPIIRQAPCPVLSV